MKILKRGIFGTVIAFTLAVVFLMSTISANAASFTVNTSVTADDLVSGLIGSGVTISNATYTGASGASATFTGGQDIYGIDSGIILSTGSADSIAGPNSSGSTSKIKDLAEILT